LDGGGTNGTLAARDGSGWNSSSAVGIAGWGSGWDGSASVADDGRGGVNWLGDGAWAVGDGDGLTLGGSVGNTVEGESGGSWADGGEGSDNVGNPDGRGGSVSVG